MVKLGHAAIMETLAGAQPLDIPGAPKGLLRRFGADTHRDIPAQHASAVTNVASLALNNG